jgi:hypothetical protein
MNKTVFFFLLLTSFHVTAARVFDPKEVPWLADLRAEKIFFFHVCGTAEILPTRKSLNRDFAVGVEKQGYFFTDMLGTGEYQSLIETQNLEGAKTALRARFEKARLWRHSPKGLTDLGVPTKIEFPFLATIKDCREGAKNSLGRECSVPESRATCCSEKFSGPLVYWGAKEEFVLKYSPDPSVRLKVPGETKNRFCNFEQINEVSGSGR